METYAIFLKLCMTWKEQIEWQKGDVKNGDRWILSSWKGTMDSSAICPSCYDHSSRPSLQFRLISVRSSLGSEAFMVIQHTSHTSLTGDKWQRSRISQLDGMAFFLISPKSSYFLPYWDIHIAMWDIHIAMWDESLHFGCLQCFFHLSRRPVVPCPTPTFESSCCPESRPCGDPRKSRQELARSDPRFGWRLHQKAVDAMWVMWQKASKRFKKAKILQRKSISCTSWTRGSSSSSGNTLGLLHPNCLRWHFQVVNSCLL